ncbi:MAG TPA: SDR family NAD(P)-dependent oxidoreductase, partial [Burkholderiales bacterium]|nr:SDR family NAD(P)-dependent oxidoreductase [Burkholderiales bacterium]
MDSLFDLGGKVAVITGSTKGIGRAIAHRMAQHGARVVISSRKADACDRVAGEIAAAGGEALAQPCNVTKREDLDALVEATMARWGRIDVLVCNAAVNPYFGPSIDLPESAWDYVLNANLKSLFLLSNKVLPQMAECGEGSVIFVSALGAFIGTDVMGVYQISKAAELQLARNIAVEWGPRGIRANCIGRLGNLVHAHDVRADEGTQGRDENHRPFAALRHLRQD